MSYIKKQFNFESTCGKSNADFDSTCTQTYYNLKENYTDDAAYYYEYDMFNIFLDGKFGAITLYTDKDVLLQLMSLYEYYTYYLTTYNGKIVLAKDKTDIQKIFNLSLTTNLFPEDYILAANSETKLLSASSNDPTVNEELIGLNYRYHVGISSVNSTGDFDVNKKSFNLFESSMNVGVMTRETAILVDWTHALDSILDTIIFQMVIFLVFICLTIMIVVRLSYSITHRITHPIKLLQRYLEGKERLVYHQANYNHEVNEIIKSLNLIEKVEKFIRPNYLLNPNDDVRFFNLEEAIELYRLIENQRGIAITSNLIGNIYFEKKEFSNAVYYYKEALKNTENILIGIETQEAEELKLSEKDKKDMQINSGDWETEKANLASNISDRTLQLCMAKIALIEDGVAPIHELRAE